MAENCIIEPCFSRYNSLIFIVPKKDGSFCFVFDYRALNENSLKDRYTMKEDVGKCIGNIGRAGSTIFSTMDLTSGIWQLPLDTASRPLTAFTCPGKWQYQYTVLSMGLKGGSGSFQRMMELAMKGVDKVLVYIDDTLTPTLNIIKLCNSSSIVCTMCVSNSIQKNGSLEPLMCHT